MEPLILIIAIPLLLVAIFVVVRKYERSRAEAISRLADELGMTFFSQGNADVQKTLGSLRLFNLGRARQFKNMMVGSSGDVRTAIFGYRYRTGGGKNSSTHLQSVFSFESDGLELPEFELRPENVFHKIGQAMGYQDIDFREFPEFSKRFVLRGYDEGAVRRVFSTDVVRFFEGMKGVSVEAAGNQLIFYRARRRLKVEDIKGFMDEGFRAYALFRK